METALTPGFGPLQGTLTPHLSGALSTIPTASIPKKRWTYPADLQSGDFQRSEFEVVVWSWTVTGPNGTYSIAGPGSRRIEDHDASMIYSSGWLESRGNFSGGTIHRTSTPGASIGCT